MAEGKGLVLVLAALTIGGVALVRSKKPAPPADECNWDADCPAGYVCENGVCVPEDVPPECVVDLDCSAGYVCEGGGCVPEDVPPECSVDSDCAPGYVCENGVCVEDTSPPPPQCLVDSDCAPGYVCGGGVCVPETILTVPYTEIYVDPAGKTWYRCYIEPLGWYYWIDRYGYNQNGQFLGVVPQL